MLSSSSISSIVATFNLSENTVLRTVKVRPALYESFSEADPL